MRVETSILYRDTGMLINPVGPVVESLHGYNSVMASHGYRWYIEIELYSDRDHCI